MTEGVPDPAAPEPAGGRRRLPWGRIAVATVVLAIAAVIAVGLNQRDQTPLALAPVTPLGQRPLAADVDLPVLQPGAGIGPEGERQGLGELRGRVVVVNLWASWCAPCRTEVPVLQELADHYEPERVLVLGINSEDTLADAQTFLRDYPFSYPSLRDSGSGSAKALGVRGYPHTMVIDPSGRVASRLPGELSAIAQLTPAIDQVLGES